MHDVNLGFRADILEAADFYRRWRRYGADELSRRLASDLPPEEATLLTKANLVTWANQDSLGFNAWCERLRGLDWRQRAEMASRVLACVGVGDAIVQATRRVNRPLFVPSPYASLAFLNMSTPLGLGSNATMFGLSALVIEAAISIQPGRVIEVGFGSGLTAANLILACRSICSYTGYEPNHTLTSLWQAGSKGTEGLDVIAPVWAPFKVHAAEFDSESLLLFSCGVNWNAYNAVRKMVAETRGLHCIVPRPLLPEEFHQPGISQMIRWRDRPVSSYAEYLSVPRAYMVLELLTGAEGVVRSTLVCSNIQYIAYREFGGFPAQAEPFVLGPLDKLVHG